MARDAQPHKATADRGRSTVPSGRLAHDAGERGTSHRATGREPGNPGTFLGIVTKDGVRYARYRAKPGTWVSASLVQQGYGERYGRDTAFGAYRGVVADTAGEPLKRPDRIAPRQEYLIPVGSAVTFVPKTVTGFRPPRTVVGATPWKERAGARRVKDLFLAASDLPYASFELRGPTPPSRVPRDAVAYWLGLHKREIEQAERRWHVSRLAIAGAIAWEALENPEAASFKAVSPGKIHLEGEDGQLGWPDVVEVTGREKPLTPQLRRVLLRRPALAIDYIGAILDFASTAAEARSWNIRNSPEILAQVYHGRTAEQWIAFLKTKPANAPFTIVPGTMGAWIAANSAYLEGAVGPAGVW